MPKRYVATKMERIFEFALPDSNNPDLAATQTFRIYDNAPRSIRLGVVFNM